MKHRYKSIEGAVRAIRGLERQIEQYRAICKEMDHERLLLAKLASKEPEFFNPLIVIEAEKIRDRLLKK